MSTPLDYAEFYFDHVDKEHEELDKEVQDEIVAYDKALAHILELEKEIAALRKGGAKCNAHVEH